MKALIVLSFTLAVAASYPRVITMTISDLETAIHKDKDPLLQPYFIQALNTIMDNLYKGNEDFSQIVVPSPGGAATWTREELEKELQAITENNSKITEEYVTAMVRALGIHKQKESFGSEDNDNIKVTIIAMDVSTWTKEDLDTALKSETTAVDLIPYLQKAINDLYQIGGDIEKKTIGMVTPVGLICQVAYSNVIQEARS